MTAPQRALLVVDVQNDFCEGGALGVEGGGAVAAGVTDYLRAHRGDYALVVASRDWHDAEGGNGGHFADDPDYTHTWPVHCVAGTVGADYHPALDQGLVDVHMRKGQGRPAYSVFEGCDASGRELGPLLLERDIHAVDIVGLATDYCVLRTSLDAVDHGVRVAVLEDLVAGVAPASTDAAFAIMRERGVAVVESSAIA